MANTENTAEGVKRVVPVDGYPAADQNCICCGLCAKQCPVGAIEVDKENKSWKINKVLCIQCGTCVAKCPKSCIKMETPKTKPLAARAKKSFALPIKVPLTKGVLKVDPELCNGCMVCVQTCSLASYGVGSFELSNMRMLSTNRFDFDAYAAPCLQCTDPQCMRYCPCNAISVDKKTGARVINQELCIGCQECIAHCPYTPARITFNPDTMKAGKCDLCGGDPMCVKACTTGALSYFTDPKGIKTGYTQPEGSFDHV